MPPATLFNSRPCAPPANPHADARPRFRCDRCPSTAYVDRPIHNGQSAIRECAHYRRFLGFPLWNGRPIEGAPP